MKLMDPKYFLSAVLALGLLSGCGEGAEIAEVGGDDASATFGGVGAKSDGKYTECQLRNVLLFVNSSSTTVESLTETLAPLRSRKRSAERIIQHRDGDPTTPGDDNLFDDLGELDDVSYVGPRTLKKIVDSISEKCEIDLTTRPFIDSNTFTGGTGGFPRDAVELEATFTVTGIPGRKLRDILLKTDSQDRSTFRRMRKNRIMEAYTYGVNVDEMPWNSKAHKLREKMPYIYFTIERGRFEQASPNEPREISLGTDIMDDVYFDTQHFDVTHAGMSMRARARWDTIHSIRRILLAAKSAVEVDAEGIKRAAKIDVRRDSPSEAQIASMVTDIQRGKANWNGVLPPVETIYDKLLALDLLPDIDGYKKVLLLEPVAHLRSTRSRFHFNEASLRSLENLHGLGFQRLQDVSTMAETVLASGRITDAGEKSTLERLIQFSAKIADRTHVLEKVNEALNAAGSKTVYDMTSLPKPSSLSLSSAEEVEDVKVFVETLSEILHDFADALDDADRIITDADRAFEDHTAYYVEFVRSTNTAIAVKQTFDVYVERFHSPMAGLPADVIAAYNAFGEAQKKDGNDDFEDFEALNEGNWSELGKALALEKVKVYQRQIEAAGTLAKGLWFDAARDYYVPASSRRTGNFIIDTTDMTDFLTHEEWESIPEAERTIAKDLPAKKIFHTTFVNEVQIELGLEKTYLERIQSLQEKIDAGKGTIEDEKALEGARFIFSEYRASLTFLAELKESRVKKYLKRNGADDFKWEAASFSKGHTALLMIADEI